ncbi:hypothetical protein KKE92_02695 [Candidatus Micrarchaeota archaeon]|nr:hypothetical protein [Candidatus Micrarchaeota archaeon]
MVELTEDGKFNRSIKIDVEWLKKSFDEGHYVEPIILLHYLIGINMNSSYDMACRLINPMASFTLMSKKKGKKNLYFFSEYKYKTVAEILCDLGLIDIETYKKLMRFNKARNDSAHNLFKKIPTKSKLKKDFDLGLELFEVVKKVNGDLHMKYMDSVKRMTEETRSQTNIQQKSPK